MDSDKPVSKYNFSSPEAELIGLQRWDRLVVSQTNSNDTQMVDHSMAARMLSPAGFDMQIGLYLDLLVEFWSLFWFVLLLMEISITIRILMLTKDVG